MEDAVKYEIEVGCFEGVEAVCVIAEHLLAVLVKRWLCIVKPFVELKFLL